jgi:hypothetical protein
MNVMLGPTISPTAPLSLIALAFLLGLVSYLAVLWWRWGRPPRTVFVGDYATVIPADLAPACVSALMHRGRVTEDALVATLLDLARRGVIDLEVLAPAAADPAPAFRSRDYLLRLHPDRSATLGPLEAEALRFIFGQVTGSDTTTTVFLHEAIGGDPLVYSLWFSDWGRAVRRSPEMERLLDRSSHQAFLRGVEFSVILACTSFLLAWLGALIALPFLLLVPLAVWMSFGMRRRTPLGEELFVRYEALENQLRSITRFKEMPASGVVIWDEYLVLAAAMGLAREVIGTLYLWVPDPVTHPGLHAGRFRSRSYSPAEAAARGLTEERRRRDEMSALGIDE